MTGSALIVTPDLSRVLLTHHKKLNLWLQLGGHADGDPVLYETALREGTEESGLTDLQFFPYAECFGDADTPPLIFDLDIHWIAERKTEEGHFHYDARFLLFTENAERFRASEESHEIRWFGLADAYGMTTEWSMHRQFDKLRYLRALL